MQKWFFLLVVFANLWMPVFTHSAEKTADPYLMRNLCFIFDSYAKEHGGKPPESWEQLTGYIDLERLSRRLSSPIQECYRFVRDGPRVDDPTAWGVAGKIILIGTGPSKLPGRNRVGRFAILKTEQGGFSWRWFTEKEVQRILHPEKTVPDEGKVPPLRMAITLDVTNPGRNLLVGEPLCVFVRASAKKDEIPDIPDWRIEVISPKGQFELELLRLNFLERGRGSSRSAWVDFLDKGKDALETTFHAVLLVVADAARLEREEPGDYPILTAVPGDYQIKIRETASKSESPPVRLRVVAADPQETKAGEIFASQKALEIFIGIAEDVSAYEKLAQTFPQSRYSAYASLILGMEKLKAVQQQHDETINLLPFAQQEKLRAATARSIASLSPYFEKTLKLNFRSAFEAKALFLLANCKFEERKVDEWKTLIQRMLDHYDNVAGLSEVKDARRAFEQLRRIEKPDTPNPTSDK